MGTVEEDRAENAGEADGGVIGGVGHTNVYAPGESYTALVSFIESALRSEGDEESGTSRAHVAVTRRQQCEATGV